MKKIFISYDYDNDKEYKNMLLAWDKNKQFDLNFSDTSADVSIKSDDSRVIRQAISAKINQADIFLCLIGEYTHKSSWVKWEIEKALELKKKIVAVKIENKFLSPDEIKNIQAEWARSFTFDAIKKAIEEVNSDNSSLTIHKGVGSDEKTVNPSPPWCP